MQSVHLGKYNSKKSTELTEFHSAYVPSYIVIYSAIKGKHIILQ